MFCHDLTVLTGRNWRLTFKIDHEQGALSLQAFQITDRIEVGRDRRQV